MTQSTNEKQAPATDRTEVEMESSSEDTNAGVPEVEVIDSTTSFIRQKIVVVEKF